MAVINSKKLLPPSKSTGTDNQKFLVPISNIIPKSSAIVKAGDIKSTEEQPKQTRTSLLFEVIRIRKKVIKLEKLINKNTKLFQKSEERKRKVLERQKFEKREKELEKKEPKNEKEISGPSLPKIGFLDRLKKFLLFTALGYAFNKFGKHIPKVLEFAKKLTPAFKFVEELTGNILNGVVDFIGAGYKAYDQVRGIAKSIGGENFEEKFDEFSKQFNIFANLAIVAGLAATGGTDFGLGRGKGRGGKPSISSKGVALKPNQKLRDYLNRNNQIKKIEKIYGNDAARIYEGRRAQGASQNRALADVRKRFKPLNQRYGVQRGLSGGTGKGAILSRGLGKAANRASLKVLGKAGTKIAKGIFGRVPIIGGLLDFAFALAMGEKPGRAAAKAVGATIGSALGTFIPIPFAGTILGGILGDIVGGALYDTFAGNSGVQKKAQGGQVTRGGKKVGGAIRRKLKKIRRRPPRIQPQRTIPGKDIGGKKEIEKLFPTSKDKTKKDPLGTLEKTSKNLKEIPMLGGMLGGLMGASVDLVMGQKPEKSVFQKIGYGFGALIQNAIDSQSSQTIESIQKQIVGLAGGGVVPRTLSSNENIGMKIGEQISRTFEVMINSKVNESLQSIRRQLNLDGTTKSGTRPGSSSGGMYGGYEPTGIQKEIYDYLINVKKMSDIQALGLMANISRESSFIPNVREPGGTGIGLFQWSHGRVEPFIRAVPDWETNWKAQIDYALNEPQNLSLVPPGEYQRRSFSSAQEAADWWMREWERPADESSGSRKHAQYLSTVPKAPDGTAKFRSGTSLGASSGNLQLARELAESMGLQMTSGQRAPRFPGDRSYHISGRAMDFSNVGAGQMGTPEMLEFAQKLIDNYGSNITQLIYTPLGYGIANGKRVSLDYWGDSTNRQHNDHVHVAFENGGKVHGRTKAIIGEKGPEFVLDADTTAALEQNFPGFLSALNRAKYDDAISVLKNYTSYEGESTSTIMLQRVIIEKPVPMPMGGGNASTSSIDSSMDSILQPLTVG